MVILEMELKPGITGVISMVLSSLKCSGEAKVRTHFHEKQMDVCLNIGAYSMQLLFLLRMQYLNYSN